MGLNTLVAQPVSLFKRKLWKVVMKCKKGMVFNFLGPFSQKVHFWCCNVSCVALAQSTHFLSGRSNIYDSCFWRSIFLLATVPIMTKNVFFLFAWQPLLRKQLSSIQLSSLSIQTIPDEIGVKQMYCPRKIIAKAYFLPHCKGPRP